ncbi:MAG: arginyltransferase, partial [Alphaproteobacteria bacterium]|nr:arginyltransferase [Alphaproteobacteria bacterium]
YFIHDCEKMSYKQRFKPLDVLRLDGWVDFDTQTDSDPKQA